VENDAGYVPRNFLTILLQVNSYEELNALLRKACLADVHRHVRGKEASVAELWEDEKSQFLLLPHKDYPACVTYPIRPNAYSQVELDTNRYSVPVEHRNSALALQAFPFLLKILFGEQVIAEHPRCFGREQDILEALHYLPLLEQRPGAFEHAKPIRNWRKHWPRDYERLLHELREHFPEGRGVREFIAILRLHQDHPVKLVEQL